MRLHLLCLFVLLGCSACTEDSASDNTSSDTTSTPTDTTSTSPDASDTATNTSPPDTSPSDAADAPDTTPFPPPDPPLDAPVDSPAAWPACTTALRPLVFAHGFLASGDNFALQAQRFISNGHCPQAIYAFDWDTLADDTPATTAALDALITQILTTHNAPQIDLIGHSAGGGLGLAYLSDPVRASKVAHYAHVASNTDDVTVPPSTPTLSITSAADLVVPSTTEIADAQNVRQTDHDHLQTLTSSDTFNTLFQFFYDTPPTNPDISPTAQVLLSGRALTLGTNAPLSDGRIFAYPLDPATGQRLSPLPQITLSTDASGAWGPFVATPNTPYELAVFGSNEARPVRYYIEPSAASSHLVYLRTFPKPPSLPGLLLRSISFDDQHAVAVIFTANQAVISGRDTLSFAHATEQTTLSIPEISAAEKSLIALFLYDANNNQTTDATPTGGALGSLPVFLGGLDLFLPADPARTLSATFNGSTLHAPAWPSDTAGAVVMIFR
jgi:hypothetical protein